MLRICLEMRLDVLGLENAGMSESGQNPDTGWLQELGLGPSGVEPCV